jgi:hypothetical protein
MEAVDIERRERDRVYSDTEVVACWNAADQLPPVERAYAKLLMLLAPRKSALAGMRRADLDDPNNPTCWVTPFELVKVSHRPRSGPTPRRCRHWRRVS